MIRNVFTLFLYALSHHGFTRSRFVRVPETFKGSAIWTWACYFIFLEVFVGWEIFKCSKSEFIIKQVLMAKYILVQAFVFAKKNLGNKIKL